MSLASVIPNMVSRFGRAAIISWPKDGGYDPATRTVGGTPPVPQSVQGVLLDAKTEVFDGVAVMPGDRSFLLAASSVAQRPREGGFVAFGSDFYSIIAVRERNGATLLGYNLLLRGDRP